jgi:hypothetical protein
MDLTGAGFSNETMIDSIIFIGWGANYPPWRGLKASFDDIRLTSYADYDVGVKEILDFTGKPYVPRARIKNFGRKASNDFYVIAEISNNLGIVYSDTLPWSLPADTEDTVSFNEFKPEFAGEYTLNVRTRMISPDAIDESDEDDELSRLFKCEACFDDGKFLLFL